jgi:hypothetical protein
MLLRWRQQGRVLQVLRLQLPAGQVHVPEIRNHLHRDGDGDRGARPELLLMECSLLESLPSEPSAGF